jgi:hypothetical protein
MGAITHSARAVDISFELGSVDDDFDRGKLVDP